MPTPEKTIASVNYIRQNASANYRGLVPYLPSDASIDRIGFILEQQDLLTEFTNGLVNRIIKTMVERKTFRNPLKIFKKGSNPLGSDIQNIFTNPALGKTYKLNEAEMAKLLSYNESDDKVVYYRRNRRDLYEVSVPESELQSAFVSWDALGNYIDNKVMSLTNGNEIDEYEYIKNLLSRAVTNNTIRKIVVPAPTDNQSAKNFVKVIKKAFGKMKFPRTDYNSYSLMFPNDTPVVTHTNSDRICLITTTDVTAEIDVELLASAFNKDLTDLNKTGQLVEVDEFKNETLTAILCDEAFLQIYDNLLKFRNFYNGRSLVYNYYVHAWSTFALSPFANAIAIVTSNDNVPTTDISVNVTSLNLQVDETFGIKAKVEPENASDKTLNFESSNADIVNVNNKGYITALATGTATITISTNNENVEPVEITVTVK